MARKPKPSGNKLRDRGKKKGRKTPKTRKLHSRFLIVCEGKDTETNYFESFRVSIKIKTVGTGLNTKSLVKKAKSIRDNAEKNYTDTWVVFDLDDYPAKDFNEAIAQAKRAKIKPAYSNESFELWFLLHFQSMIGNTISRFRYYEILSEKLGKDYEKTDRDLYQNLLPLQSTAIQNAEELMKEYEEKHHNPAQDKPCTTVYKLVQELKRHER